jgi:hypothetical protein
MDYGIIHGMETYIKNIFTGISLFSLALFTGNGFLFGQVNAQTTSTGTTTQGSVITEFKHDVEQGVQEVKNDKVAQKNQQEIDSEDNEKAGDNHGEAKEIDGENNQSEIDNEIDQEVEQEDGTGSIQQNGGENSQSGYETTNTTTPTNVEGN